MVVSPSLFVKLLCFGRGLGFGGVGVEQEVSTHPGDSPILRFCVKGFSGFVEYHQC